MLMISMVTFARLYPPNKSSYFSLWGWGGGNKDERILQNVRNLSARGASGKIVKFISTFKKKSKGPLGL